MLADACMSGEGEMWLKTLYTLDKRTPAPYKETQASEWYASVGLVQTADLSEIHVVTLAYRTDVRLVAL